MFSMYDQFFFPPFQGVIVVSDSELKDLKLQRKQHDLKILEKQRSEIDAAISEINNEIKLLTPSKKAEAAKK
tara:strand:- start:2816 stop:3031 length:216 start_codon:yes stop_codon:yes gene_type:complete